MLTPRRAGWIVLSLTFAGDVAIGNVPSGQISPASHVCHFMTLARTAFWTSRGDSIGASLSKRPELKGVDCCIVRSVVGEGMALCVWLYRELRSEGGVAARWSSGSNFHENCFLQQRFDQCKAEASMSSTEADPMCLHVESRGVRNVAGEVCRGNGNVDIREKPIAGGWGVVGLDAAQERRCLAWVEKMGHLVARRDNRTARRRRVRRTVTSLPQRYVIMLRAPSRCATPPDKIMPRPQSMTIDGRGAPHTRHINSSAYARNGSRARASRCVAEDMHRGGNGVTTCRDMVFLREIAHSRTLAVTIHSMTTMIAVS